MASFSRQIAFHSLNGKTTSVNCSDDFAELNVPGDPKSVKKMYFV